MKSGYKLLWSERALTDLKNIIDYLTAKWTEKEIKSFVKKLDKRLELLLINPRLFQATSKRKNVRRSVLTKQTVIYYTFNEKSVTIVTLFDSRQNPKKLRL